MNENFSGFERGNKKGGYTFEVPEREAGGVQVVVRVMRILKQVMIGFRRGYGRVNDILRR